MNTPSRPICRSGACPSVQHLADVYALDVADVVAIALVAALAIVPYNYGTGRWTSEWTHTTWGIGLMIFVVFMPWFVVAIGIGADQMLVPLAMLLLVGAFGVGYYQHWRRFRSRR